YKDTSPFELTANASQLNIADLKNLANLQTPVTGTLSADVSLHGTQLNPIGHGTVSITQATVADEPIQSANLDFEGTGDEVRARVAMRLPAGAARGNVTYFPERKAYDGEF